MRPAIDLSFPAAALLAGLLCLQDAGAQAICTPVAVPGPASIPESYTALLSRQRPGLDGRLKALTEKVNRFNEKCAKVAAGSKLDVDCAADQADLKKDIAEYRSACERFNQQTVEAVYLEWDGRRRTLNEEKLRALEAVERSAASAGDNDAVARARQARAREEAFRAAERRLLDQRLLRRVLNSRIGGADVVAVGRIVGQVCLETMGQCLSMPADHVMLPGESIRTGPRSRAEVVFADGSRVLVGENGSFQLTSELDYTLVGKFYQSVTMTLSCLGECRRHRVKSPYAAVSRRNTEYAVEVTELSGFEGYEVAK